MRLRSLLAMPELRLEVVTGADELDRAIRWVVTTDLLDPGRYLRGGELVLTGLVWRTRPADSETFVRALASAGVSGLAAWDLTLGTVPDDLVDACRRHRLPLFKVPEDVAFATVTEEVVRNLSGARAADLAAVLDRHRRLVEGTGLGAVLDLVGHCHVLTPTGRVTAGPPPLDPAGLARAFLTAPSLPRHVPGLGASLFPVSADTPRIADWFIAFEGDFTDWPAERRALTTELAAIVALERTRLDAPRTADLRTGSPDEFGLPAGVPLVAVAASGRGALRPDDVRAVLAEILPSPVTCLLEDEVLAVVPSSVEGDVAAAIEGALDFLAPGLTGGGGLAVGVSDAVGGSDAVGVSDTVSGADLRGAIEEARYGRRLAVTRPSPMCVVRHDELATHVLLLASVPEDVRRIFQARLLEPLDEYDKTHGADLVRTLETFLQNSGSWTRCAKQLHLHVNSVRYRIQRIEELTGRDLSRLEDCVDFFLALRLT
ncbi:PucR family transcriptional regulator ligand-binding domain-containing protein [Spirillospora sp. NPDC047418]